MKCDSCGQEFARSENIARDDSEGTFCIYCADSDGKLLPKNEVRESIITYWMKRDSVPRETAEQQVDQYMDSLPAWKNSSE